MNWINVNEKLPEIGFKNEVLIHCKREYEKEPEVITGWLENFGWCSIYMREDEMLDVFYQMPLPELPCGGRV